MSLRNAAILSGLIMGLALTVSPVMATSSGYHGGYSGYHPHGYGHPKHGGYGYTKGGYGGYGDKRGYGHPGYKQRMRGYPGYKRSGYSRMAYPMTSGYGMKGHQCGGGSAMKGKPSGMQMARSYGSHGGGSGMAPSKTVVDVAVAADDFNTLVQAVKAAGLVETLSGAGPFTVFAPTDAAFGAIPKADLQALLADKEKLTEVLTYHVVSGKVKASDVVELSRAKTVQGGELRIDTSDGGVKVDGANVVKTDIMADNGVIHVIDQVLMPGQAEAKSKTIVDVAVSAGQFDTLVTAVKEAGLVETLSGEGPFTVFAPTDAAFGAIPEADLKALLADQAQLTEVLTYHVVPGRVMAADVVELSSAETVQGGKLDIETTEGGVRIDGAHVVTTDVMADNGVIHVIDQVLMP